MTIEKPPTRLELMTAAAHLDYMGFPARYIRYVEPYESVDEKLQDALVAHGVVMEYATIITRIIESYLSRSFFIPPFFELKDERSTFYKKLPDNVLGIINNSNTRKSQQEHVVSALNFLLESTPSCQQLAKEIKQSFYDFEWEKDTKNAKVLIAHTESFREHLLKLCFMFTTHTSLLE